MPADANSYERELARSVDAVGAGGSGESFICMTSTYGHAIVDDPRHFTPDTQVCSEAELQAHFDALRLVERGDPFPEHRPARNMVGKGWYGTDVHTGESVGGVVIHVSGSLWGMGINWFFGPCDDDIPDEYDAMDDADSAYERAGDR